MIIELKSRGTLGNIEAKADLSVKDIKALTRVGTLMNKAMCNGDYEKAANAFSNVFERLFNTGLKVGNKIQSSMSVSEEPVSQ